MGKRTGKRMNDGNMTGLKQDRFRNSSYEYSDTYQRNAFGGVTRATPNTLGAGRDWARPRQDNPFDNQETLSWNRNGETDQYYDQSYDRRQRNHGGALLHHDLGKNYRGLGPRGYARPDERIYEDVCEMLSLSADVDASEIEVSVREGCVFLTGNVERREIKRMAEFVIENVSGVRDVQNNLTVQGSERSENRNDRNEGERARALS